MPLRPALLAVLLAAAGLLPAACASRDPVAALVDAAVEAAEDRDAQALAELLAEDFAAADGADRAAVTQQARQVLMAYRALDVEVSDLQINRRGDSARATFRARLTGVPATFGGLGDLVPRQSAWDFDVTARERNGRWALVSASWKDVSSP